MWRKAALEKPRLRQATPKVAAIITYMKGSLQSAFTDQHYLHIIYIYIYIYDQISLFAFRPIHVVKQTPQVQSFFYISTIYNKRTKKTSNAF